MFSKVKPSYLKIFFANIAQLWIIYNIELDNLNTAVFLILIFLNVKCLFKVIYFKAVKAKIKKNAQNLYVKICIYGLRKIRSRQWRTRKECKIHTYCYQIWRSVYDMQSKRLLATGFCKQLYRHKWKYLPTCKRNFQTLLFWKNKIRPDDGIGVWQDVCNCNSWTKCNRVLQFLCNQLYKKMYNLSKL